GERWGQGRVPQTERAAASRPRPSVAPPVSETALPALVHLLPGVAVRADRADRDRARDGARDLEGRGGGGAVARAAVRVLLGGDEVAALVREERPVAGLLVVDRRSEEHTSE